MTRKRYLLCPAADDCPFGGCPHREPHASRHVDPCWRRPCPYRTAPRQDVVCALTNAANDAMMMA